jgi:nitrogen fixation protein FixH
MAAPPSPRRNLWPHAIVATFVLFAAYIGTMVQQALRTSVDLVSPDYYQQELRFQQRLDAVARTAALPAPVRIHFEAAARRLQLTLPPALAGQPVQGTLQFFRPSDQRLDLRLPFAPTGQPPQQTLSTRALRPGLWRLRLDFTAAGQAYFLEKELTVE